MGFSELEVIIPVIISFGVCVVLCPLLIPFLKRMKFGQFVRQDGPESHLKIRNTYNGWNYNSFKYIYNMPVLS